jgi:hypothetical protein
MADSKGDVASLVPLILVGVAMVFFLGIELLRPKSNATEPPVFHSTVPIFGHIIGLIRTGTQYYAAAA